MGNIQSTAEKPFSTVSNSSISKLHNSYDCFYSGPGKIFFTIFNVIHVMTLLPLCTFVLYLGLHRLQRKSPTSPAATISHCDIFTYHMVVMELSGVLGFILCLIGNYTGELKVFFSGFVIFSFTGYGQLFFHILTCVERYLAVVHPVTYLSMKNEKGIRIRNATIGLVWLLCFAFIAYMTKGQYIHLDTFLNILSTAVVFFCSVSVLFALIRPGPGQEGRERADQSKQRAFYTIAVILGVLMLRLFFGLVWAGLDLSGNSANCITMVLTTGVNLPSSLVLPLLFLHRTGKLMFCENNTQ